MSETLAERKDRIASMDRHELSDYIFALEERVWPGHGHLGGMEDRDKSNLVAVALMYHQIEDEGLAQGDPEGSA